uniref:Anoctamin transmembrane domain-containing protein n=1 Tax=Globisporangium ultimum (strain ATCC 200006 / CBS 805.95 / DAOM BR144) TaxID=431595 RepID=K3XC55_GLOUD
MLLLASQLYALSNCIELQQQILGPATSKSRHTILQSIYELMSDQTCAPITQWRAHTCAHSKVDHARNRTTIAEEGFDSVCEEELASLMLATLGVGVSWLSWLAATHLLLLLSLLLPDIGYYVTSFVQCCCRRFTTATTSSASSVSQSDPIVDSKHWKQASLQFQDARRLYLSSARAKDSSILEAEAAAFDFEWMAMTGRSAADINKSTVVFQNEFEAIVRSLVIRRLALRCKMDVSLSISKDGRLLFVKIFASDNLLMATLCDMDYTLEFTDEVDPGPLFWSDKTEVKNDLKVLDPHTIKQKLRLLAAKDVISRKEAEQFPNESLSRVSGRIQVLTRASRIANKSLKCHNVHLPYAPYVPRIEFQYLYKKYPNRLDQPGSVRRSIVLRTIDCIRITRHLIESEMNVNQMLQDGLLASFQCLHSASRFDFNSKPALRSSWILFWRPRHLPGEFEPESHWFLNQLGRLYPFRQPLRDVRDYFGESIAFYFAWIAFYTHLLVGPAIGVAIVLMYQRDDQELQTLWYFYRTGKTGNNTKFFISSVAFALGIGIIVWGFLFAKLWERKCIWYQLEWGTTRLDLELHDRASFWGELCRNPVTNEIETHFSGQKRLIRQCGSLLVMLGLGAMNLFLVITFILMQGYLTKWLSLRFAVLGSSGCQAILIQWSGDLISSISHRLSEFENYQNEKAFQDSVVSKVFALQLMNTYTGLWILAFADFAWLEHTLFGSLYEVYHANVAAQMSVLVQLETLLLMIFVTRIVSHILAVAHNFSLGVSLTNSNSSNQAPETESASVEGEHALEPYRGSYEDYTQVVVQFGLVVMFSSVFPLAPLLALIECALEIRLDALDLCLFFQRPAPDATEGIGLWSTCIQMQLKLALVTIFGLKYFTAENHRDLTFVQRMGSFLISTLGCWLLAEILWFLLPSTNRHAEEVQARNEFLVERYMGGDDTQPSDDGLSNTGELNKKNWILDDGQKEMPQRSLHHLQSMMKVLRIMVMTTTKAK